MLSKNRQSAGLPGELKKYFWDVNFDELTFDKYPRFIAERILNYGDLGGVISGWKNLVKMPCSIGKELTKPISNTKPRPSIRTTSPDNNH